MEIISEHKSFNGTQYIFKHPSSITNSTMRFGIYLPIQAHGDKVPVLYWLSGLTCTEENFITKAGAQRMASKLGIAIVTPDTSPRGLNLPHENDSYDLGTGAGFYVDATQIPWSQNYKMYSYLTEELTTIVEQNFSIDKNRVGIFGHSMGGHGALTIALKNPDYFKSVSAFAPICSPINSPWGKKAFQAYLGSDESSWLEYDATHLLKTRNWNGPPILIDQGSKDEFLKQQLHPELLERICAELNIQLRLRIQAGYDHSYFFIATFIEDHLKFHAENLCI